MYRLTRALVLRLLRAPEAPPDPPPGAEQSVRVFRASANLLKLELIRLGLWSLVLLVPLTVSALGSALADDRVPLLIVHAVTFVLAAGFFWLRSVVVRLDYEMRYYLVTDRAIRIREGAVRVHEHTYTYANVQNLTIEQEGVPTPFYVSSGAVNTSALAEQRTGRWDEWEWRRRRRRRQQQWDERWRQWQQQPRA